MDWIEARLGALDRVDAYRHSFYDARAQVERTNIYGILRASPLADGKVMWTRRVHVSSRLGCLTDRTSLVARCLMHRI